MKLKSFRRSQVAGAKNGRSPAVSEVLEHRRLLAAIGYYDVYSGEGNWQQDSYFAALANETGHTFTRLDDLANTDFAAFDAVIIRNANNASRPYEVISTANGESNPLEFIQATDAIEAAVAGGLHVLFHDITPGPALVNDVLPGDHELAFGTQFTATHNQTFIDFVDETTFLTKNAAAPLNDSSLDYQSGWSPGYNLYGGWADVTSLPDSFHLLVTGEDIGTYPGASRATTFAYDYGSGRVTYSTILQASATGGIPTGLRTPLSAYEKNLTLMVIDGATAVTNTAPVFADAPDTLSVQYSDVLNLTFSATDNDGDTLSASILSDGGLGIGELTETDDGVWSATPIVDVAAGEYEVVVGVSDGSATTEHTITVTVSVENATVEYAGLQHFTFAPDAESPSVRLRAMISDISVTDSSDENPGNVLNAQVRFYNMDDPYQTLAIVDVNPATIDLTDAVIGYATADVAVSSFKLPTTRVGVEILGDHYAGELAGGALVTIAFSTAGRVSGGGRMELSTDAILRSAGLYAGDAGSEMQYGFSGRYRQNTGDYEGDFEASFYSGGQLYRLISTSIDSLSTYTGTDGAARADMAATVTLYQVTGKKTQAIVSEGLQVNVTMTDASQSGSTDSLGLTVWDPTGGLVFSNLWDGVTTLEQEAAKGNTVKVWDQ